VELYIKYEFIQRSKSILTYANTEMYKQKGTCKYVKIQRNNRHK